MPDPLLRTKLFVPPVQPNLVSRPHLIRRLNQGLQFDKKLTLISAPAGFGKSTLVANWLAESGYQAAWLSLDPGDSDPARFWTYLIAAIQIIHQAIGVEAHQIGRFRTYSRLPRFIRSRFWHQIMNSPKRTVNDGYNVLVISVGMFGAGGGHIVPYTDASLCIGIGGITKKLGIVGERIEPQEFLSVTVTFDHDITDGAPAARFAQALKDLIECGDGLIDQR